MTPEQKYYNNVLLPELVVYFPEAEIIRVDPSTNRGKPDYIILNGKRWAALETKRSPTAGIQPNQEYWVNLFNDMSYASFVYPENQKRVIAELRGVLL